MSDDKTVRQAIFDYMYDVHDVPVTESECDDIALMVNEALAAKVAELEARQQWVAVEDGEPPYFTDLWIRGEGYEIKARLEDVDYCEMKQKTLYGWVTCAADICFDDHPNPTHWRYVTPPTEDKPERNTCYYLEGDLCTKQAPCDCYPPDTTEDKPGQVLPEWQGAGEYLEGKGDA